MRTRSLHIFDFVFVLCRLLLLVRQFLAQKSFGFAGDTMQVLQ